MNEPILINLPASIPFEAVESALGAAGLAMLKVGDRYRIGWIPESILGDTSLEIRSLRIERDQLREMLIETIFELAELRASR
jgi:hypothetical protein